MTKSTAQRNQDAASDLSNDLSRLLKEFSKDFEHRILASLHAKGHQHIRGSHSTVFSNLGLGAVRVTELAERAQVTQQAMGKTLKEIERLGYIARDIDEQDKRAREIRLTECGVGLVHDYRQATAEARQHYAEKIGLEELDALETILRTAVAKINLSYLPDSWANGDNGGQ